MDYVLFSHCILVNCIKWLQASQLDLHCKISENAVIIITCKYLFMSSRSKENQEIK